MIARIIPIKRLPLAMGVLDYRVPDALVPLIRPGQLARIPFRHAEIYGVIVAVMPEGESDRLKDMLSLVQEELFLNSQAIALLRSLAGWYHLSPGSLTKMMLPPLQKRKLVSNHLQPVSAMAKKHPLAPPTYHLYTDGPSHAGVYEDLGKSRALVLVPEMHRIDDVWALLPEEIREETVIWHSQLSQKEQSARWFAIRNQEKRIVLGTRGAVFLPFQELDRIIIDYEHDENHKHWDQAPRFHAKDVARRLAEIHGSRLTLASFAPSNDSYFRVHKGQYTLPNQQTADRFSASLMQLEETPSRIVVDMTEERRARHFSLFSRSVTEALQAATGDIFLFINRRGFATSAGCQDCGLVLRCPACDVPLLFHEKTQTLHCHYCRTQVPLPHDCPACTSPLVALHGAGTEFVEKEARHLFGGHADVDIIRLDSDSETIPPSTARRQVIIGTEMAFRHVRWGVASLIVFLGIDKQLALPEFLATEHVWQRLHEVDFRRNTASTFYIQTNNPKHLVFRSLGEPDRFYRTDLNARQSLHYPPYYYVVRYFFGHADGEVARRAADHLHVRLQNVLTEAKKPFILEHPIEMYPRFYRNQFWYTILVKLPATTWPDDLVWLNQHIPGNWKVDPNPISLLSP